jgi:hypothetical protein
MFLRVRQRRGDVWERFRIPVEGFVVSERRGLFEARLVANAGWAVDLFLALSGHLSPRVHMSLHDVRAGREWHHEALSLADARAEVLGMRSALASRAGVECALFDDDDQITLSAHLEVFVYSRTDRWYYFLRDLGLRPYVTLPPRSWRLRRGEFPPAPDLQDRLHQMVEQLQLVPR